MVAASAIQRSHGRERSECTDKLCQGTAKFAFWLGDEFSRVSDAHESMPYHDGDLHPHVCEACLPHYKGIHGEKGEFVRPAEKLVTDGGSERSIYLAGPIEADDSPRSWRDELRERFPEVDWIDPMDWQDEWEEDPAAVWEREMETVRNNAVLACNIGDEAPRTTGTHHEIREALNHGQPVAIVPEGTVSQVYREIEDVWIYREVEDAVADLTSAELVDDGLRADGWTEQPREFVNELFPTSAWEPKARENIEKWGNRTPAVLLLALAEEVGEVADEMLATGEKPLHDSMYSAEGVHLLSEVRHAGFACRDFLEEHFKDEDGAPLPEEEMPRIFHDVDEELVLDEVDDAAPLLFLLSWALNGRSLDTGSDRRWCDVCDESMPHRMVGDTPEHGPEYQCLGCIERVEIEAALGIGDQTQGPDTGGSMEVSADE